MKLLLLFVMIIITLKGFAQNVGIGTTNPQATLDVRGSNRIGGLSSFVSYDSVTGRIEWRNANLYVPVTQALMKHSAAADGLFYNNSAPVSGQLEYRNAAGNPVFFTNFTNGKGYFSGDVGIGTTTPGARLHVRYGLSGYTGAYHPGAILEGDFNTYLQLLSPDIWENGLLFGRAQNGVSSGIIYNHPSTPDGLQFRTGSNFTRMTIDETGRVGIGTLQPQAMLHVAANSSGYNGPQYPGAVVEGNDNTYLNILSPDNKESSILFGKASNLASGGIVYNNASTLNGLQFRTNGNQTRMVINSSGNVGIGNTAPAFPLHFSSTLGDKIGFWGGFGSHYGIGIASNMLFIHTDISVSDIAFGYGGWGFFTERMRVKGNGNVGIGTSAPSEKLEVTGNVIAGSFKFSTPKTLYYSISPTAFRSDNSALQTFAQPHQIYFNSTNTPGRLLAPVYLPDGARLVSFKVYYEDTAPIAELQMELFSTPNGNPFDGGTVYASTTTAAITGNTNTTVSIGGSIITNASQNYYVTVKSVLGGSAVNWPANQLVIRAVVIGYTMSEAQ